VSSKRLCEKNVSGEGLTIDVCIHAYKEKVRELAKLRSELAASGQFMRYFDKGAREKLKKLISFCRLNWVRWKKTLKPQKLIGREKMAARCSRL